jgi:tyrosine-protein kinase Etk/Wzc
VAMDYIRRLREVKYREAVFDLLAKQFEAAKVDEAKQAALIQVLEPAIEPDRKSSPNRTLLIELTAMAALLIGTLFSLVIEVVKRAERDPARSAQLETVRGLLSVARRRNLTVQRGREA